MIVKSQSIRKDNKKNESKALNEEPNLTENKSKQAKPTPLKSNQQGIPVERPKIPKMKKNIDKILIQDTDADLF